MIIRKYKSSDLDEIMQLFADTVHSIGARYYDQAQVAVWAPEQMNIEKWRKSLEEHTTFVAEQEGHIIGFADLANDGYLDRLYIHKNYQARGVAFALIKRIEQEAREQGIATITTHASICAMPLAKRIGYVVINEQTVVLNGVKLINYVMEKKLQ